MFQELNYFDNITNKIFFNEIQMTEDNFFSTRLKEINITYAHL